MQLQVTPDGLVIVRGAGFYADTKANFAADFGVPLPVLPDGFVAMLYDDATGMLCGYTANGTQLGLPITLLPVAKAVIAGAAAGIVAKTARLAPTPAAQVDALRDARLAAGFSDPVSGKVFQTDDRSRGFLTGLGAAAAVDALSGDHGTYLIVAADNTTWTGDALATDGLIRGRLMPWVTATVLYARNLKNLIAAGTPPADLTVGWP